MINVVLIADENELIRKLSSGLAERGFLCSIIPYSDEILEKPSDLILIAIDDSSTNPQIWGLPQRLKQERHLPVIALLSPEALGKLDYTLGIDDFVLEPCNIAEIEARAKRVLWQINNIDSKELIKCGDLVIDLRKCEVFLSGRLIALTFKEYELLRFLASNRGRVFSRESLLNRVWGYDYFGGDRTVDVHIRRLRSKIEDSNHTFIETVRNIGYKFKENA